MHFNYILKYKGINFAKIKTYAQKTTLHGREIYLSVRKHL